MTTVERKGISYGMTSFFLMAQLAGAGFLALPQAFANTGWLGLPMLLIFCGSVGFSGTRLGQCWVMLEERWEEYRQPARQPYMEIAYRAYGNVGRKVILVCVLLTLVGTTTVYLILISQFLNALFPDVSICLFATCLALVFMPFSWLGTPKDFWEASVMAVTATVFTCLIIFIQLLIDRDTWLVPTDPVFENPTVRTFSLGFGSILFAFGGASGFPTIQNDMKNRSLFWKSVGIAFTGILVMYLPVAITGYALFGSDVPGNILLYRGSEMNAAIKVGIAFEIINLLGTYLIAFNPVCQIGEEMLSLPKNFGIHRVLFRSGVIVIELIIALAIPDFGLILNLVGGSTVTICSFIAPPLMYMKLVNDRSNPAWPKRTVPLWQKFYLYEIASVGLIGGICSTVAAVYGIVNSDFSASCFADYSQN